jgi:hypothetical protein
MLEFQIKFPGSREKALFRCRELYLRVSKSTTDSRLALEFRVSDGDSHYYVFESPRDL